MPALVTARFLVPGLPAWPRVPRTQLRGEWSPSVQAGPTSPIGSSWTTLDGDVLQPKLQPGVVRARALTVQLSRVG